MDMPATGVPQVRLHSWRRHHETATLTRIEGRGLPMCPSSSRWVLWLRGVGVTRFTLKVFLGW
jgi:hypothetical protein